MPFRNQEILLLEQLKEICKQKLLVQLVLHIVRQQVHEMSIIRRLESLIPIITPVVVKVGLYLDLEVLIQSLLFIEMPEHTEELRKCVTIIKVSVEILVG